MDLDLLHHSARRAFWGHSAPQRDPMLEMPLPLLDSSPPAPPPLRPTVRELVLQRRPSPVPGIPPSLVPRPVYKLVFEAVLAEFPRVTFEDLKGEGQRTDIREARRIAGHFLSHPAYVNKGAAWAGQKLEKDHTSVLGWNKQMIKSVQKDAKFREHVERIREFLDEELARRPKRTQTAS